MSSFGAGLSSCHPSADVGVDRGVIVPPETACPAQGNPEPEEGCMERARSEVLGCRVRGLEQGVQGEVLGV